MITKRSTSRPRARRRQPEPAPVTTRYECPRCGGEHNLAEHRTLGQQGLSPDRLRALRAEVLEELALAVRRGADHAVLADFLAVLDGIDVRLERASRGVERRQQIRSH